MRNYKGIKVMLKRSRTLMAVFMLVSVSFSVNAADDEILLPDISTTILKPDNGIPVETEAVPDFRLLLPEAGDFLPDIADAGLSPDTFIPPKTDYTAEITDSSEGEVSNVFIEGAVGGGYPGLFSGVFSVYRNEGREPFSLDFSHQSENGYGLHSASAGFSNSSTKLSGKKTFVFADKFSLDLEGLYSTETDGLQGKSPLFYMLSNQNISGKAEFVWAIDEKTSFSSDLGLDFSNQFAGYNGVLPDGVSGSALCFLAAPHVSFTHVLPFSNGSQLSLQVGVGYSGGNQQNRVEGGISADYLIGEYGTLSATTDVVWTKNMAAMIVVPFQLGFKTGKQFPFTGSVSGGLKSSPVDFNELRQRVPYMFTNGTPYEESLWFASADLSLPFEFQSEDESAAFFVKKIEPVLKADFEKTAFGNKSLKTFTKDAQTGLMISQLSDSLVLNTSFGTSFSFLIGGSYDINLDASWKGCWFDRYVLEEQHSLSVRLGFSSSNGNWGAETEALVFFQGEEPDLKLSAFYKLSDSMRLELEVADLIKLVTGKDRIHCGEYIQKGGYAALYVKMFF